MSNPVLFSRSSPNPGVTSRLGARLRSQIDSVFIPVGSPDDDSEEKVMLLMEGSEEQSSIASSASESHLFRRLQALPLHAGERLLPEGYSGPLLDVAVFGDNDEELYFIAANCNRLFRFLHQGRIVTSVELKLDSLPFFPDHLRLEEGGRSALLTGWTKEGRSRNLLVRVELASGAVTSRTRAFDMRKFGALALGSEGGSMWVASPAASPNSPEKAQVFELSSDFRRKVHFVNLNSERAKMTPLFLATDTKTVFVSVYRRSLEAEGGEEDEESRLLSFPAAPTSGEAVKTKEWLSVTSWNFQALSPGRLVALTGQKDGSRRLLVLDRKFGSLHVIIWPDTNLAAKPLCLPVRVEAEEAIAVQGLAFGKDRLFLFSEREIFAADVSSLLE